MAAQTVRCPICRKKVAIKDPEMPFCSERCRTIDLANWATEKYVVPAPLTGDEDEGSLPTQGPNQ